MSKSKRKGLWLLVLSSMAAISMTSGCSGTSGMRDVENSSTPPNDALNSTLWALRSAENDAVALSIYRSASALLETASRDVSWTALPQQAEQAGYSELPPAVILDVDETVLDNGKYQVDLLMRNESYASDSWLAWVLEERATPIPGALEYTRHADAMGVTVIYLTNRRGNMEEATRRNLTDLGFPIDTTFDAVLTRGERPEWSRGEKTSRRNYVAEHFRVVALLGDNLGDFVDIEDLSVDQRDYEVYGQRSLWGSRWFMLPNPLYGSWESSAFGDRYDLTIPERRRLKMILLEELVSDRP
ncbi:MAG TPA: HAD family acid phosphatase [Rhodothermales bacterium]|nr:HAD family acid phosphatase [Rhodothermales bacterium]